MKCSTLIFCTIMRIYNVRFEYSLVKVILLRYLIPVSFLCFFFADADFVDWKRIDVEH
jgi:hypothetical protein